MRYFWAGRGDDIANPNVSVGSLAVKHVPDVGPNTAMLLLRLAPESKTLKMSDGGKPDTMGGLRHRQAQLCIFNALGKLFICRFGTRGLFKLPDILNAYAQWTEAHLLIMNLDPKDYGTSWQQTHESFIRALNQKPRRPNATDDVEDEIDQQGNDEDDDAGVVDGVRVGVVSGEEPILRNGKRKVRTTSDRQRRAIQRLLEDANVPTSFDGKKKVHLRGFVQKIAIEEGNATHEEIAAHHRWGGGEKGRNESQVYYAHYMSTLAPTTMLSTCGGDAQNKQSFIVPESDVGVTYLTASHVSRIRNEEEVEDDGLFSTDLPGIKIDNDMRIVVEYLMGPNLLQLMDKTRRQWLTAGRDDPQIPNSRTNATFTTMLVYVVVCFVQDIDAMIKWGGDALWNEIPYAYLRREKCGDNVADALQRIRELVQHAREEAGKRVINVQAEATKQNQQLVAAVNAHTEFNRVGHNYVKSQLQHTFSEMKTGFADLSKKHNELRAEQSTLEYRVHQRLCGAFMSAAAAVHSPASMTQSPQSTMPPPLSMMQSPQSTMPPTQSAMPPTLSMTQSPQSMTQSTQSQRRLKEVTEYQSLSIADLVKALAEEWGEPRPLGNVSEFSTVKTIRDATRMRMNGMFDNRLLSSDEKRKQNSIKTRRTGFFATYQLLYERTTSAERPHTVQRLQQFWEANGIKTLNAFNDFIRDKGIDSMAGTDFTSRFDF